MRDEGTSCMLQQQGLDMPASLQVNFYRELLCRVDIGLKPWTLFVEPGRAISRGRFHRTFANIRWYLRLYGAARRHVTLCLHGATRHPRQLSSPLYHRRVPFSHLYSPSNCRQAINCYTAHTLYMLTISDSDITKL